MERREERVEEAGRGEDIIVTEYRPYEADYTEFNRVMEMSLEGIDRFVDEVEGVVNAAINLVNEEVGSNVVSDFGSIREMIRSVKDKVSEEIGSRVDENSLLKSFAKRLLGAETNNVAFVTYDDFCNVKIFIKVDDSMMK